MGSSISIPGNSLGNEGHQAIDLLDSILIIALLKTETGLGYSSYGTVKEGKKAKTKEELAITVIGLEDGECALLRGCTRIRFSRAEESFAHLKFRGITL